MAEKDHRAPDEEPFRDETAASGPTEESAGPSGQSDAQNEHDSGLTVEDILNAEQHADAAADDTAAGGAAAGGAAAGDGAPGDAAGTAETEEESSYLEDLRRITAEYANYRKRTEANAVLEKQRATAAAVSSLLGVLDDLDRAEAHDDLVEGTAFHTIAQKIRGTLERLGLESFGEKGEAFDPSVHEAIAQVPVPGTEEQTVLDVIERGYRIGEVELRPAKVAVAVGADG
ncbi:nucleotide exchange factor GrpE [Leucobacter sp. GX24907]